MTGYPSFCGFCHGIAHAPPCDPDALERRRQIRALGVARERLRAAGDKAIKMNNYRRAGRIFSTSLDLALRVSDLLAEEADAIMGRRLDV